MPRLLEYLEDVQADGRRVNRCRKCGHVLGLAADDYKTQAAVFETPISEGEPEHFAPPSPTFVLRHFICPGCAVLFEIDMLPAGEPSPRSVQLA